MSGFLSVLFRTRKQAAEPTKPSAPQQAATPVVYAGILGVLRELTDQEVGFAFEAETYTLE